MCRARRKDDLRSDDSLASHIVGNIAESQHQVLGRIVRVEVNKIFEHRERLVL